MLSMKEGELREANYQFFKLTAKQDAVFTQLKSEGQLPVHGPLELDEEIEMHKHPIKALYIVDGITQFCGTEVQTVLGTDQEQNAVLVAENQIHGWLSRLKGTKISQVHDPVLAERVLSAV